MTPAMYVAGDFFVNLHKTIVFFVVLMYDMCSDTQKNK